MPAAIAIVVITIGRARFMPASMIASSRGLPSRIDFDREFHQHDGVLGDDAHQHQDADPHRRGELLAGEQQRRDRAADRERQREQDGDRLQEGAEQQHQHRIDHHQAGGDRGGETFRQFVQAFGVAGRAHLHALRQALHDRQFVDLLGGVAERGGADEVGGDGGLALAVIAVDAGRALVELDVGDHRERHAALLAVLAERHAQLLAASAGRRARRPRAGPGSAPAGRRRRTWPAPGRRRRWWRRGWSATGFRWRRRAARRDRPAAGCEARAGRARFPRSRWR